MNRLTVRIPRRRFLRIAILGGGASLLGWLGEKQMSRRPGREKSGNVQIKDWCIAGPRFEFPQRALVPLFRESFPAIDIEIVTSNWSNFYQKVAVAIASSATQYDIIFHDYSQVPALASTGGLETLDPYVAESPGLAHILDEDIPTNVRQVWQYGGHLYGIPPDGNSQLMYWRRDVLDRRGIRQPTTWDEVLQAARELTHGSQYGLAVSAQRGISSFSFFASMLWSHGGTLYNPSNFEVNLHNETTVKVLTMMRKLMLYADPVSLNGTNDDVIRSFGAGRSIMAPVEWGGTGLTSSQFNPFSDMTGVDRVPMGSGPGADHVGLLGGLGFLLPANSGRKREAFEWMRFVLSDNDEVERIWVENTGQPVRQSVLQRFSGENALFGALLKAIPRSRPFPILPEGPELMDRLGTQVSLVLTDRRDPEGAARTMQTQVEDLFVRAGYR